MSLFSSKSPEIDITDIQLPVHIGIIMDGNGRWAKKRGLPRTAGHKVGAETFRKISRYCSDIGIKYLTVYAFSTENWRRPLEEVNTIMVYFRDYLNEALRDFADDTIRVKFLGDISQFPKDIQELMIENEKMSAVHEGMVLNIAMNYGGRAELVTAMRKIAKMAANGEIKADDIDNVVTEKLISDNLYTAGQPDPDLIIRPSGEYRTSNFLLWQSAYAEYYIDDVLWPDYTKNDLNRALIEYSKRNRRFGGV
ncbi:MAG: isoprenyl transferase [Acutalibacteraceae bacterium]|nr:isoprenyl transferase [Acutalibacteraceae bacterium]